MSRWAIVAVVFLAQAGTPQQPIQSAANYVRVDVHPTKDGRPVADLSLDDFEILEDGVPQKIVDFRQVAWSADAPPNRPDPESVDASRQALASAPGNVFVLFLDTAHVSSTGSRRIGPPLGRLIDRIVGPEDLIGVMTADMAASQVVFGRKTAVIRDGLLSNPEWGRRFERTEFDQKEQEYAACYPMVASERKRGRMISRMAQELIERRRERMTLDAFGEIVAAIAPATQARTTVLAVSEGWPLFRPDDSILEPRLADDDDPSKGWAERPPGGERIRVTPEGRLGVGDRTDSTSLKYACDRDRLRLAALNDQQDFRDLMGAANRRNVSFYTIDPRGLTAFDTAIQSDPGLHTYNSFDWDRASLTSRQGAMRDLATNTGGLAVMDSLEFDRTLQRIADDVSSYYLIGYYSTNPTPDGKFRQIAVKVSRPGVDVRARRGYRAPSRAELESATAPSAKPADDQSPSPLPKPLLFKTGATTGNRMTAAERPLFSRTERVHAEVRLGPGMTGGTARFLDRMGQTMALPVAAGERTDPDGTRWLTADVSLAPLAPGNYAIELSATDAAGRHTVTSAIQVTR